MKMQRRRPAAGGRWGSRAAAIGCLARSAKRPAFWNGGGAVCVQPAAQPLVARHPFGRCFRLGRSSAQAPRDGRVEGANCGSAQRLAHFTGRTAACSCTGRSSRPPAALSGNSIPAFSLRLILVYCLANQGLHGDSKRRHQGGRAKRGRTATDSCRRAVPRRCCSGEQPTLTRGRGTAGRRVDREGNTVRLTGRGNQRGRC